MKNKVMVIVLIFIILFAGVMGVFFLTDKERKDNSSLETTETKAIPASTSTSSISTETTTFSKVTTSTSKKEKILSKEKKGNLAYFLYKPKDENGKKPLIVYLHNSKVQGNNLDLLLKNGLPKLLNSSKVSVDAYVIMPQLPKKYGRWSSIRKDVISLIDYVSKTYNIDKEKISLTGHSIGGRETFEFAIAKPNMFYKIAPLSANVSVTDKNVSALKNVPTWAIVGSKDTVVSPSVSKNFIKKLEKINPNAKISEIAGANHLDVADKAFKNYELLKWLIN